MTSKEFIASEARKALGDLNRAAGRLSGIGWCITADKLTPIAELIAAAALELERAARNEVTP